MSTAATTLEEVVADIFDLFDKTQMDVSRLVVYGSALEDVQTANDIDLVVIGDVGASLEKELAFHMTMDRVWPEEQFGPSDMLVITEERYEAIKENPDKDGETVMHQHLIEAVREGQEFQRSDVRTLTQSLLQSVAVRLF